MMTWKMFRDNFGKIVTYFGSQRLNLIQLNLIIMDFISIVKHSFLWPLYKEALFLTVSVMF